MHGSIIKKFVFWVSLLFSLPAYCDYESYLGLSLGKEYSDFKQRALVQQGAPANTNIIDKNHFSGRSGSLVFLGGLAKQFCTDHGYFQNLYLGLEANLSIRKNKYKATNVERNRSVFSFTRYTLRHEYGLGILPGILFSECSLLYARLGYSNTQFISSTTDDSLQNLKKHRSGFRYGVGLRQSLTACWALRLEGSQTNYQTIKMFRSNPSINFSKETKITPQIQKIELALLYIF